VEKFNLCDFLKKITSCFSHIFSDTRPKIPHIDVADELARKLCDFSLRRGEITFTGDRGGVENHTFFFFLEVEDSCRDHGNFWGGLFSMYTEMDFSHNLQCAFAQNMVPLFLGLTPQKPEYVEGKKSKKC